MGAVHLPAGLTPEEAAVVDSVLGLIRCSTSSLLRRASLLAGCSRESCSSPSRSFRFERRCSCPVAGSFWP